jgi:hypothetical protein
VPKVVEFHERLVSSWLFRGESISTNIYAKNIINAMRMRADQRTNAESFIFLLIVSPLVI